MSRIQNLAREIWKNRMVYTLLLPGLIWYIIFAYGPMGGLTLAFKTYKASKGIWGSPWCGFQNYVYVFRDPAFLASVWKTLYINIGRVLAGFCAPIILALMINEIPFNRYKKIIQTVATFPQFLSWVVVSSIMINFFSYNGPVNFILSLLANKTVNFLGNEKIFIPMLYVTEIWKTTGWYAIIYLAAIAGINPEQYEAARIDGVTRIQNIFYITLPNIMPTISIMLILTIGNLMSAGFDQVFNLSNAAVRDVSEILDMYIYRITFQSAPDFSFSTAVSLFRAVINMVLLLMADRIAKLLGGEGLIG
mgnify:FL=1